MAKPNLAGKIKEMARNLKDADKNQGGVKKIGDALKNSDAHQKQNLGDSKLSGRKN